MRTARSRALTASAVLIVLLAGIAVLAITRAQQDSRARGELESRATVVSSLNDAKAQFFFSAALISTMAYTPDRASIAALYPGSKQQRQSDIDTARSSLVVLNDTDAVAQLDAVTALLDQVDRRMEKFAQDALNANTAELGSLARQYQAELSVLAGQFISNLEDLSSSQRGELTAEHAAADRSADRGLTALIAFSGGALAVGVIALLLLSRSVLRPLSVLQERVRAIASGDLDTQAPVGGPYEVAALARDFNDMVSARRQAEDTVRKARDELEMRVEQRTAELDRLVRTDALTGLVNHRELLNALTRELAVAARVDRPLAVVMADIDSFKLLNDTSGHPSGDEALRQVAGVLRRLTEGRGIAGRYGGDEFIVLLPGADKQAGIEFAHRLAAAIGEMSFRTGWGTSVPIRLSAGVASFPEDGPTKDRLLTLVDAAMYEAKRLGVSDASALRMVPTSNDGTQTAFGMLDALIQSLQYRDDYTKTHSDHVASLAAALAQRCNLSDEAVRAVRIAGALHDIGKLIVPDEILKKPGALTGDEQGIMKRHPLISEMLISESPFHEDVVHAVGCHHERYDGTGYPRGLAGERIPILGRIMAVADAYSAMSLDRPYRKGLPPDRILAELRAGAGTQFDPHLVNEFIEMLGVEDEAEAAA